MKFTVSPNLFSVFDFVFMGTSLNYLTGGRSAAADPRLFVLGIHCAAQDSARNRKGALLKWAQCIAVHGSERLYSSFESHSMSNVHYCYVKCVYCVVVYSYLKSTFCCPPSGLVM